MEKLVFEILGTLTAHKANKNKMRLELIIFQTFDKKMEIVDNSYNMGNFDNLFIFFYSSAVFPIM